MVDLITPEDAARMAVEPPLAGPIRLWLRLHDRKAELEAEVEKIAGQLAAAEEICLNAMTAEQIQQVRIDGRTVFTRRDLWAGPSETGREALIAALQLCDQTCDFVRPAYNAQTLSAWARELERSGEPIPPELQAHIKLTEKFSVRVHT